MQPDPAPLSRITLPPVARATLRRLLRTATRRRTLGPVLRRSVDILGTGFGLVLIAPVLLAAMLLVKLTSPGKVFFAQPRVGHRGRSFKMWKLRTMYVDADKMMATLRRQSDAGDDGVRFKMRRDPRVTPVGRILRKLSIDELPQLWNVVRGDMTLVGPRPALAREVQFYDPRALRRLEVKPGLTCLWQIGGRSDLSFNEQVDLDLAYIDATRPLDEIRIVVKTVPAVVLGRGAY